jgi:hypothetical protein
VSIAESGDLSMREATELNDSDYPPVSGFHTDKPKPMLALIDKVQVSRILNNEGYGVNQHQVKPLHFFPSPMDSFQYALYHFGIVDIYIVLMINKRQKSIYGYHILDLTQEYSLVDDLITRMKTQSPRLN